MAFNSVVQVSSSVIESLEHDAANKLCRVNFVNGNEAVYHNFSLGKFLEFASAESVGHYYNVEVKNNSEHAPPPNFKVGERVSVNFYPMHRIFATVRGFNNGKIVVATEVEVDKVKKQFV